MIVRVGSVFIYKHITHHNNELYIADACNHRLSVWTVDGRFVRHITIPEFIQCRGPVRVAVNTAGEIFVRNALCASLLVINPDGTLKTIITEAGDVDLTKTWNVCTDNNQHVLVSAYDDHTAWIDVFNKHLHHVTRITTDGVRTMNTLTTTADGDIVISCREGNTMDYKMIKII